LKTKFEISVEKIGLESSITEILSNRIVEIERNISIGNSLSSIILIGSVMEGILLGMAQKHPDKFNKSKSAPKADITSALVTSSKSGAAVTTVSPKMVLLSLAMIEFFKSLADIFLISLAVQLNNLFFIFFSYDYYGVKSKKVFFQAGFHLSCTFGASTVWLIQYT